MNNEDFFRHPGWDDVMRRFGYVMAEAKRPAEERILDDVDLCELLKVSKRTTASLRAEKLIAFSKCGGKILYKLSDVLEYINRNRVDADPINAKSRIK